MFVTIF